MSARTCLLLIIAFVIVFTKQIVAEESDTPITAVNVSNGVCVILGASGEQPALIPNLLQKSRMIVYGLCCDDEDLAFSRSACAGVENPLFAGVEKSALHPLPLPTNIANVVIVAQPEKLSAAGLERGEIERIAVPGGTIFTRNGAGWTLAKKQRPSGMDDWTHPAHGPDGNAVSRDAEIKPPFGPRWFAGVPKNVIGSEGIPGGSAARAVVAANGRIFSLGANAIENVDRFPGRVRKTRYLSARDAFNGTPLWTLDCAIAEQGITNSVNASPLATDGQTVWTAKGENIIAVEAETGRIKFEAPVKFQARHLLHCNGVIVAGCWQSHSVTGRYPMLVFSPNFGAGSIEAFDAATGAPLWSVDATPFSLLADDGRFYGLVYTGAAEDTQHVCAWDIRTGKPLWSKKYSEFSPSPDVAFDVAGPGFLVIQTKNPPKVIVLANSDGHVLWEGVSKANWTPVVDGLLWSNGLKKDPLTGAQKGSMPLGIVSRYCQLNSIVNGCFSLSNFGLADSQSKPPFGFPVGGVRNPCVSGMIPANGMLYLLQTNCRCVPGALCGEYALGTVEIPPVEEFEARRPVEKGSAFNAKLGDASAEWPTYRGNSERSASVDVKIETELEELWSVHAAPISNAKVLAERLSPCITAPIAAAGTVFCAAQDAARLGAFDAATGRQIWNFSFGGRLATPPTFYRGLLLQGCNDGWVYALKASDGTLAWRTRIAPRDDKLFVHGRFESRWPAIGSVLILGGVAYANAGRSSQCDGGIALVALVPETGETLWSRNIGADCHRLNDILSARGETIAFRQLRFDHVGQRLGQLKVQKDGAVTRYEGAISDGLWTVLANRRSCNPFDIDASIAPGAADPKTLAWNEKIIVTPAGSSGRNGGAVLWRTNFAKSRQVETIVITANAAIFLGRDLDEKTGRISGFIRLSALPDGAKLFETAIPSPPVHNGIALDKSHLFLTLEDGSLHCYGR